MNHLPRQPATRARRSFRFLKNNLSAGIRLSIVCVLLGHLPWSNAWAENFERGAELYDTQCQSCHDKPLQKRANSPIRSLTELRQRIANWGAHIGEDWSADDTDDVLIYLNQTVYHFKESPL